MNKWHISLLLILLIIHINAQNFQYADEDWYILTKPGSISSITEDNFFIYIATENGIYSYDKVIGDFQYDYSLSVNLRSKDISHFYFDKFRDFFWLVNKEGISFKSSVSSIWREMSLSNSGIYSIYDIDDIGSSLDYFWIRSGNGLYPFDPFSGLPANTNDAMQESGMIKWGYSKKGIAGNEYDISPYVIDGEWKVGMKQITHRDGTEISVTVFMEDDEGNKWYGTDKGYILKSWSSSYRLELITIGLPFDNVTEVYNDDNDNWWFADSRFKRTGNLTLFNNYSQSYNTPFISKWNEYNNEWTYYFSNESIVIKHEDINCILELGSTMYFGTMFGVLYLDLFNRDWNLIDASNGLNDSAVWDIVEFDNSIFVATSKGLNEISIIDHSVLPNIHGSFKVLNQYNIYDLEIDSLNLYLSSNFGLYLMNMEDFSLELISEKNYKVIRYEESGIMGSDGSLWLNENINQEKYIASNVETFDICGTYIWSVNNNEVTLTDTITSQSWTYSNKDGIPGNKIYDVNCDMEWVWFLTNKGVGFYNWSRYH